MIKKPFVFLQVGPTRLAVRLSETCKLPSTIWNLMVAHTFLVAQRFLVSQLFLVHHVGKLKLRV